MRTAAYSFCYQDVLLLPLLIKGHYIGEGYKEIQLEHVCSLYLFFNILALNCFP